MRERVMSLIGTLGLVLMLLTLLPHGNVFGGVGSDKCTSAGCMNDTADVKHCKYGCTGNIGNVTCGCEKWSGSNCTCDVGGAGE
ncbi:hypothetical protein CA13_11480 [Planctomycetes bacterium CA13]|uniref:Uncharacterized protein n=1 Tax=Novipirellula herctigrandis TaxID=2527986 RepID=A0A5C5YYR6_9BACT|nr:hypothetical protein CA13_11480 [Planctomycetes bacterium CA13]